MKTPHLPLTTLYGLADGELAAGTANQNHLAQCPACRQTLAQIKELAAALGAPPLIAAAIPPQRVLAALARQRPLLSISWGWAAAILALLGLQVLCWPLLPKSPLVLVEWFTALAASGKAVFSLGAVLAQAVLHYTPGTLLIAATAALAAGAVAITWISARALSAPPRRNRGGHL